MDRDNKVSKVGDEKLSDEKVSSERLENLDRSQLIKLIRALENNNAIYRKIISAHRQKEQTRGVSLIRGNQGYIVSTEHSINREPKIALQFFEMWYFRQELIRQTNQIREQQK
jgi:hypothetical protein